MFHIFVAHSVKEVERSEVFWNNIRKNTSKFPELMVDETMALNVLGDFRTMVSSSCWLVRETWTYTVQYIRHEL